MLTMRNVFLKSPFVAKQLVRASYRGYMHVKHLGEQVELAEMEEIQRSAKYLEYTQRIYKPSKTIEFNRDGDVLLFSVDNYAHV